MIQAYKNYWTNYFNFSERTSRGDYWRVFLMNLIVSIIVGIVIGIILRAAGIEVPQLKDDFSNIQELYTSPGYLISNIWTLITLIPGLAIGFRRLHDTNRSGLWYLTLFIPIAQLFFAIAIIVFYCLPSVEEGNRYGTKQV